MKKRDILERRRTIPERIFFVGAFVVLAIWSVIVLYMFVWALMNVFKTNIDYLREPLALPDFNNLQWKNFLLAIEKLEHNGVGFWGMLFNSIWLVGGSAILLSFSVTVTGYIFAQYDFKGKELLFKIVMFIMIIPIYGSLPATYKLIYSLHLNDSPLYLITQIGGFSASMMITYGFFKGVPRAYREAVYIDGGSDFRAFITIGLPMGKNILIAYFLLNFSNLLVQTVARDWCSLNPSNPQSKSLGTRKPFPHSLHNCQVFFLGSCQVAFLGYQLPAK